MASIEHKVGETFTDKSGKLCICVSDSQPSCGKCVLLEELGCGEIACFGDERSDHMDVHYEYFGFPAPEVSELPDSGNRRSFGTGSVRDDDTGKSRSDLISPFVTERFGQHMRRGAVKYSPWNWAQGQPSSQYFASLNRHLLKYAEGDNSEDHLCAALFNLMGMIHNEELCGEPIELMYEPGKWKRLELSLLDMPKFRRGDADAKNG